MVKYIGLILTMLTSFGAISTFDITFDDVYNKSFDWVKILSPGILFSFYILILKYKKIPAKRFLISFSILVIGYVGLFFLGQSTWGIAVPFAGGFGGILIVYSLSNTLVFENETVRNFFVIGFFSSLIGLVAFYLIKDFFVFGVGYGIIIIMWQLAIGLAAIKHLNKNYHQQGA